MAIDIEVLIVSYGSAAVLERCLASVCTHIPGAAVGIREHGDRAACEAVGRLAHGSPSAVRVEHDPSNPGFGAGCNALARASRARWLLFLNPDAEVLAWPWRDEPLPDRHAVIGPTMRDSGHPGDHSGTSYRIRDEIGRSWFRYRGRRPSGAGFVSGAALLIDADSFTKLGGFDEGFFMYYEDIDLCRRANSLGIPTEIEPRWVVRHARAHSTRSRLGQALVWSYESGCRFHQRSGSNLAAYRCYVVTDSAMRSMVHRVRGDRATSAAYRSLARRGIRDLVRRSGGRAGSEDPSV